MQSMVHVLLIYWMEGLKIRIMQRVFLIILVLLANSGYKAQDSVTYNLKQCIDIAIKNNLNLKLSEFQMESSNQRLQQARAANLPSVSAYANQGINSGKSINPYTNTFINQQIVTGQYGINAGLTLWNGFSTFNSMRQTAMAYQAGKSEWEQAKIDLTINVILAYLSVLSNEEQLNQSVSQVEVSKTQADRLSVLEKNNAVSPSVLYDTRGQLANDKLSYLNSKAGYNSAKTTLAQLMNVNFGAGTKFEKLNVSEELKQFELSADNVYAETQKMYPSIKAVEYRRLSALKGLHASRGQLFPSLTLNGSLGTNYSDAATLQKITGVTNGNTDQYVVVAGSQVPVMAPFYNYSNEKISFGSQFKNNLNSYVGLSLQFNLFNSLRTKTQMSLAKINKQQAEIQQKASNTNLKLVVNQAHADMITSYERLQVLKDQVKDYEASFKIATSKFEKGALSTVDFVIAKSNFDKASMNLIAARYDYILKVKVLEYYMGKN